MSLDWSVAVVWAGPGLLAWSGGRRRVLHSVNHFKDRLAAATKLHYFGIFFSEASLNIKRNNLKGGP